VTLAACSLRPLHRRITGSRTVLKPAHTEAAHSSYMYPSASVDTNNGLTCYPAAAVGRNATAFAIAAGPAACSIDMLVPSHKREQQMSATSLPSASRTPGGCARGWASFRQSTYDAIAPASSTSQPHMHTATLDATTAALHSSNVLGTSLAPPHLSDSALSTDAQSSSAPNSVAISSSRVERLRADRSSKGAWVKRPLTTQEWATWQEACVDNLAIQTKWLQPIERLALATDESDFRI